MLIPSYSRISAFALIAELFKFFYDPSQQRGELPLAREQRKRFADAAVRECDSDGQRSPVHI